jgi:hypothetical protein
VVLVVIVLSLVPIGVELWKARRQDSREDPALKD